MCKSKENGGLGFGDIRDFNQALLAKQAWKILNESQSLMARMYKGRYFANGDFLECGKGYRPSYAWRSIQHGRELLKKGLMRSIGDGTHTKVWMDRWIFDVNPRRPMNKQRLMNIDLQVSELLTHDRSWNVPLLEELFPPADVKRILSMAVGGKEDKYVWAYTDKGSYNVKSGYWFLANNPLVPAETPNNITSAQLRLKQRVWKIKTSPKIRLFLWRIIVGALAVANRLVTRGLNVQTTCRLCDLHSESINHVLFTCTVAQEFWSLTEVPLPATGFGDSLESNMDFVFSITERSSLPVKISGLVPWVLWSIWKNRNAVLFSQTQRSISSLVQETLIEATTWMELNNGSGDDRVHQCPGRIKEDRWQRPQPGMVKCNLNGNWRNPHLHCGGAWVARDHTGLVLFHARDAFTKSQNRIIAEFRCMIWALLALKDMHFKEVTIASDCISIHETLRKPQEWPRYRNFIEHIQQASAAFDTFSFELETHTANRVAREIAKSVTRDGRFNSYMALGGPTWLHDLINRDAR